MTSLFRESQGDLQQAWKTASISRQELRKVSSLDLYTYTKDEAKLRLRDKIQVFGAVSRANIRPTDPGPVILPEGGNKG